MVVFDELYILFHFSIRLKHKEMSSTKLKIGNCGIKPKNCKRTQCHLHLSGPDIYSVRYVERINSCSCLESRTSLPVRITSSGIAGEKVLLEY